jgi:hypothetical protein
MASNKKGWIKIRPVRLSNIRKSNLREQTVSQFQVLVVKGGSHFTALTVG